MSRPAVDLPSPPLADPEEEIGAPPLRAVAPPSRHGVMAVLAAPAVALAALLAHKLLPNQQIALPTRAYPQLLEILLAATLFLAVVQWIWLPLRPLARYYGPLLAGGLFLLGLWDVITLKLALMPLPYFPGPDLVFQGILDDRALLWDSILCSMRLLLSGYAGGVAAGVFCGVMIGWFLAVRYWGMPVMKLLGPFPPTALVPLAMVLFTNRFLSAAALIAWAVWFPVTMLTTSGIANVPVSYLDCARTLGAGRGYLIFRVAIPAALPSIFVGLFMGLLVSFLALIVAEGVGVANGLGYYITLQRANMEYAKVYGAMVVMAVCFSGLMTLLFRVRDWVLVWQKGVIRW